MKKKIRFKRVLQGIGVLLFQIVPLGIVAFYVYSFKTANPEGGWLTNEAGDCQFFTTKNQELRSFAWTGDCVDGFIHGTGTLTLFEANKKLYDYHGSMLKGKLHGKGEIRFATDGDHYEGDFKESYVYGFGRFFNDDGDHYEGQYEDGLRSGHGTYWYEPESDRYKYSGLWKDGQPNGLGTLFYRNGDVEKGIFKEGEWMSDLPLGSNETITYPKNVLITNDDGMEDINRLVCLAEAMSEHAEMVVVVASSENRSGTSSMMSMPRQGFIKSKLISEDKERNIFVYEVDGYPADCVMFGALGVFGQQGKTIDLVISGINGGSNIGAAWFGSGTIGAARTAALARIPAIAVSGIDEESSQKEGMERICHWVADLAGSPAVAQMNPFEYFTISLPDNLEAIKGVKVMERAITFDVAPFHLEASEGEGHTGPGSEVTWNLKPENPAKVYKLPAENDVFYYVQDYIVVTPMGIDENRRKRIDELKQFEEPMWTAFQK